MNKTKTPKFCTYEFLELEEQISVLHQRKFTPDRIATELNADVNQVIDILHSLYHSNAD